jgi:hypothetical protein
VCRPKDQGGLGILDLQLQNKCLLAKWLVNLLNIDGLWQKLLTNKYLNSKSLSQVKAKPYDSHCFWAQLQCSDQAKDAISLISRKLETTTLEMVKGGWQNIYRLL